MLGYTIVAPDRHDSCLAFNGRTVAVVDILEAKDREKKIRRDQLGRAKVRPAELIDLSGDKVVTAR